MRTDFKEDDPFKLEQDRARLAQPSKLKVRTTKLPENFPPHSGRDEPHKRVKRNSNKRDRTQHNHIVSSERGVFSFIFIDEVAFISDLEVWPIQ